MHVGLTEFGGRTSWQFLSGVGWTAGGCCTEDDVGGAEVGACSLTGGGVQMFQLHETRCKITWQEQLREESVMVHWPFHAQISSTSTMVGITKNDKYGADDPVPYLASC